MDNEPINTPAEDIAGADPRKKYFLIGFFVVAIIIGGIFWVNPAAENPTQLGNSNLQVYSGDADKIMNLTDANNFFSFNLIHQLQKEKDANIFFSPFSISTALTMTMNGANGTTLAEMQNTLGLNKFAVSKVNDWSKESFAKINNAKDVKFSVANSIWTNQNMNVAFLPSFSSILLDKFNAEAKSAKNKEVINSWVEDKTNGKIKNILSDFDSVLYLVNAIYFKGAWLDQFQESATKIEQFHLSDGRVINHPLMSQSDYKSYFGDKNVQIVELPYKGDQYSMTVFLPSETQNIDQFVAGLEWEKYKDYQSKLKSTNVELKLPKFSVEYSKELTKFLQSLGMTISFTDQADFSRMSSDALAIAKVIHKSFIKVDEEGAEAAAATVVAMELTAILDEEKPIEMTVNRPFFFTINDRSTKEILFAGIIKEPKE